MVPLFVQNFTRTASANPNVMAKTSHSLGN
jgi:hypothetical protein